MDPCVPPHSPGRPSRRAALAGLCVVLVALLAYHRQLRWWFTGPDTLTLIETSRVQRPGEAARFFTEPLMAGTDFLDIALFYRPVSHLSYALDHALWGLEPMGYHITNLLIHGAASGLAFLLARRLGASVAVAWAAGVFFALHPLAAEAVPAIERRQDPLTAVFLLAAVLLYLKAQASPRRAAWTAASLGAGLLALGAEEVAVVLPAIVFAHAWSLPLSAPGAPLSWARIGWAVRRALPYAVLTGAFLAWRATIVGGLGGYPSDGPSLWALWWPVHYLASLAAPYWYVPIVLGLTPLTVGLLVAAPALATLRPRRYRSEGLEHGPKARPLRRRALKAWTARLQSLDAEGRAGVFLVLWLASGALLFAAAGTYSDRSGYPFLAPFAVLVALLAARVIKTWRAPRGARPPRPAALLLLFIATASIAMSPAVWGHDEWRQEAELRHAVVTAVDEAVAREGLAGHTVHVHDLPWGVATQQDKIPRITTLVFFQDITMESWIVLQRGEAARPDIIMDWDALILLDDWPEHVTAELVERSPGEAHLLLRYA